MTLNPKIPRTVSAEPHLARERTAAVEPESCAGASERSARDPLAAPGSLATAPGREVAADGFEPARDTASPAAPPKRGGSKVGKRFQRLFRRIRAILRPEVSKTFLALRESARAKGAAVPRFAPYYPSLGIVRLFGRWFGPRIDPQQLQTGGSRVIPWTVNSEKRMKALLESRVDGIITDRPDLLRRAALGFDEDGDGEPGDFVDAQGLIRPELFEAQGHRGARGLRPENTLPSMEAALDNLCNVLEFDVGICADGVPVVCHDTHLLPEKGRRADGGPIETPPRLRDLTLAKLQSDYVMDRCLEDFPLQRNDRALSPVAVGFASSRGLRDPYAVPALGQLIDFVRCYAEHYRSGPGRSHPDAALRAKNADAVRFNVEIKSSRKKELAGDTPEPGPFAKAILDVLREHDVESRASVQSFDPRPLEALQTLAPRLPTNLLVNDWKG